MAQLKRQLQFKERKTMLTYIWAEDLDRGIGYQGHLPWHLPADLHHFKELTMGRAMVMGKNTFLSLPKVLPGRKHLVLTHDRNLAKKYEGDEQVEFFYDLTSLKKFLKTNHDQEFAVIGGASIFKAFENEVDRLEMTKIKGAFAADTFMPKLDFGKFEIIHQEQHAHDDRNDYDYTFFTYQRKNV